MVDAQAEREKIAQALLRPNPQNKEITAVSVTPSSKMLIDLSVFREPSEGRETLVDSLAERIKRSGLINTVCGLVRSTEFLTGPLAEKLDLTHIRTSPSSEYSQVVRVGPNSPISLALVLPTEPTLLHRKAIDYLQNSRVDLNMVLCITHCGSFEGMDLSFRALTFHEVIADQARNLRIA